MAFGRGNQPGDPVAAPTGAPSGALAAKAIRADRDALFADSSLRGTSFCRAYSNRADAWLTTLLGSESDVALVAVGGYGRAELAPGSDLDVVLLHKGRKDVRELAERIWYPLWDAGLKLGHGVRTVKEALALAATDLDTATSFLDVRLVAGDSSLGDDLARRALAQWQSRSDRWLSVVGQAVAERHEGAGEVAFLLEPDLKEGRGGLRDVHAQHWAEAARRILLEGDEAAMATAYETLLAVRVALHRRTGKASNRLLLQEQDGIAADLGYADADALMAEVAAAARTIAWTSDETWDRILSSVKGPRGRTAPADRHVGPGIVIRDDIVELTAEADPLSDPTLVLRAAAAAAEAGLRLSRAAIDRLAAEAAPLGDPWPEEARLAFVRLLGAGAAAIPVIETLDQRGLMTRTLPEWEAVRNRPQRNAYHRFTVDRHLCEAAAEAARLTSRVRRPDLLLVGAFLHDIGKGHPGDHSEAGVNLVDKIGPRIGFLPDDISILKTLVRHHLLLAETATRRDLADEATISTVVAAVGNQTTLEILAALTEADSLATGPAAWGSWKAGLIAELVERTAPVLAGQRARSAPEPPPDGTVELIARAKLAEALVLDGEGPLVTVVAPDRPGLFWRVAGTLALHGLDVVSARAWSSADGFAIERFRVQSVFGRTPDWSLVESDLNRVLAGRLSLEARLADRARDYASSPRPPSAAPARLEVSVDNDASDSATVIEVRAPDRIGTLYRITKALAELELDVRLAKVTSLGHEVVDAFYVVDHSGGKLTDEDHLREIQRGIAVHLA
ncbi:MAG: [protein-PII] uridylyltransferase [Actinomycetota bacterium]|nr:[protein-PII] uridylyltransferase [Actinomycetota bacterium]